ncbi:MAG: DUF4007 family protein [Thermodesulfobacteriota bacterium]
MSKLNFYGHESFTCKQFWLKKGYDFVKDQKRFSDNTAVIDLGVGKNMVNSIRFWMKSFGLMDDNENVTAISDLLFSEGGKDPFLEDFGTIWLLHYCLIKTEKASIYSLIFNEFRRERVEFTKEQLHLFLKRKCQENDFNYNPNTINSDINVFLRNYTKLKESQIDIEDDFSRLFIDLDLIKRRQLSNAEGKATDWFKIESEERRELSHQIILYAILDNLLYGNSISFKDLQIGYNSPGLVFAINAEGLFSKIEKIVESYPQATFTETAGIQVLQFKSKLNKLDVLNDYYGI